jgi:site-specific recombinase
MGTSILLGFMLAALPVAGAITGAPIDLRHVTISAGSVTLALASQPALALAWAGSAAICGVLLVGLVNLTVGFGCALATALRADGLPVRRALPLLASTLRDVLRRPWSYLLPVDRSERKTIDVRTDPMGTG